MTGTPGAKTTVTFQGIEVTATKNRLWHVEAAGRSASAGFLDQALDLLLPRLSYQEQENLLILLLTAPAAEDSGAEEGSARGEAAPRGLPSHHGVRPPPPARA